jgi:hypothetical protein
VQAGLESSLHSKSHNDSRGSIRSEANRDLESKELLEAIGELNQSRNLPKKME